MTRRRTLRLLNLGLLALGIALLVALVVRLDPREVAASFVRAGWMFVPAFVAYALNLASSAASWRQCFAGRETTPPFPLLYAAFWAGHALNTITPGSAGGELLRGTLLSRRQRGEEVAASLVVYGYLNLTVTLGLVVVAPAFCAIWLDVPARVVGGLLAISLVMVAGVAALRWLLRRGLAGRLLRLVQRLPFVRFRDPDALAERAAFVDAHVRDFRSRRPAAFLRALALSSMARVFQVLALWAFLLALMPGEPAWTTFLLAMLTRAAAQMVNWVMAFIPGRVGVTEGGIALLFELIGLEPTLGLSLWLLNRAKLLLGTVIGLALGAILDARVARVARDPAE